MHLFTFVIYVFLLLCLCILLLCMFCSVYSVPECLLRMLPPFNLKMDASFPLSIDTCVSDYVVRGVTSQKEIFFFI